MMGLLMPNKDKNKIISKLTKAYEMLSNVEQMLTTPILNMEKGREFSTKFRSKIANINSDTYTNLAPGLKCRIITSKNDIRYNFERSYKDAITDCDFVNNTVIFTEFKQGDKCDYALSQIPKD